MQKQQSTKYFLLILLIAVLVIPSVAMASWWNPFSWGIWNSIFHFQQQTQKSTIQTPVVCPTIAKLCPNGSYVSPQGPKCEYPACPSSPSTKNNTNNPAVIKSLCIDPTGLTMSVNRCGNIYVANYNPIIADGQSFVYDLTGKLLGMCGGLLNNNTSQNPQKACDLIQNCDKKDLCTATPTPIVGGDRDTHGCIASAGYTWCEQKQKCLRTWEEKCETTTDPTASWKTYTNTQYGFSIKYPSAWVIKTDNSIGQTAKGNIAEVSFTGKEGEVDISFPDIFPAMCTNKTYKEINIGGENYNACHYIGTDGVESWTQIGKDLNANVSVGVVANVNPPLANNETTIMEILKSLNFNKD